MGSTKLVETLCVIFAIAGTILISFVDNDLQLAGFYCYIVGNSIAFGLFLYKKMYILLIQYVVFTIINIFAIYQRIVHG